MLGKILILIFGFILIANCTSSVNITLPESKCNNSTDFISYMKRIPSCTSEAFYTDLTNGLIYSSVTYYDLTIPLIVASPDLNIFFPPYKNIITLIESFYKILFLGLGLYYIIGAPNIESRAQAKEWLKNVFLMICFISFSFVIFKLLVNLNTQLSTDFYNTVDKNIFDIKMSATDLMYAMFFSGYLFLSVILAFGTLLARYMLIPFLLFLVPFAIFLYFIPPLKKWGSFLFTLIIPIVFLPTFDAIFLSAISMLFSSADPIFSNPQMKAIGVASAIMLIGLINVVVYLVILFSVISQALKVIVTPLTPIVSTAVKVVTGIGGG